MVKKRRSTNKTGDDILIGVLNQPTEFVKKLNEETLTDIKKSLKNIYDSLKSIEAKSESNSKSLINSTLPELIVEKFDDEQIWQQIELQNAEKMRNLKRVCAKSLDAERIFADDIVDDHPLEEIVAEENEELEDPETFFGEESEEVDVGDREATDQEEEAKSSASDDEERAVQQKSLTKGGVDDRFFKMSEMEAFLDSEDKKEEAKISGRIEADDDEDQLDYFAEDDEEEDDDDSVGDAEGCKYKGFFDPPTTGTARKKVSFDVADDEMSEDEENEEKFDEDKNDGEEMENDSLPKSSFELRQKNLKQKIDQLEQENLSEKPWQQSGEVNAKRRPENSLLEEHLLFEHGAKLPPVITQQTTNRLEDIIKQRIKDKAWDDVERKVKPVKQPYKYKNDLILDGEKSKESLSQIYEKEFLKQTQKEQEEVKNPQHEEIRNAMKSLFVKLDALTNYHYTPKLLAPEVKVINNMKKIVMEEVAPIIVGDGDLLAPEEIKSKTRGEIKASEERTKTDKLRDRKRKKFVSKMKAEKREEKEKRMKVPKDKLKVLEKLGKVHRTKMDTNTAGGKSKTASSQQFFAQLQTASLKPTAAKKQKTSDSSGRALKL